MTAQPVSLKTYAGVFGMLLVLTAATTAVAYVNLGFFNVIVALTIAVSKALLVILFFMHLSRSAHRTQIVAGTGILWLLILITFTISDVLTRAWISQPVGW
jgi:cytochrome c oxidase subunit 4